MSTYVSFAQDQELVCFCEEEASYPGGYKAMQTYLLSNIVIPEDATYFINGSSKVYASFIVTETGDIKAVRIERGISKSIDDEIVRVLRSMPRWNAAWKGCHDYSATLVRIPISLTLH